MQAQLGGMFVKTTFYATSSRCSLVINLTEYMHLRLCRFLGGFHVIYKGVSDCSTNLHQSQLSIKFFLIKT